MRKFIILTILLVVLYACKNETLHFTIAKELKKDTSTVTVKVDTSKYLLENCVASLKNDSLQLSFIGNSWYDLQIVKLNDSVSSNLYQIWAVTDTAFVKPAFKTVQQEILFDKENYKKGDRLQAEINLSIIGYHEWPDKFIDTVVVNGRVKTTVN